MSRLLIVLMRIIKGNIHGGNKWNGAGVTRHQEEKTETMNSGSEHLIGDSQERYEGWG